MSAGRLVVIPWHIGDMRDTTFNAALAVRRLTTLLVEDLADARFQLGKCLGVDADDKELLLIPETADPEFLDRVLAALERGDVGMLSSGGTPGFVDPGAWLVAELRRRGRGPKALAGPSCLAAMLALSGIEWRQFGTRAFTFAFFLDAPPGSREDRDFQGLARRPEPLFVFLLPAHVERCLSLLEPAVGRRPVTLFFDLTKPPSESFAMADEVRTLTCAQWRKSFAGLPWNKIQDVALMVGP